MADEDSAVDCDGKVQFESRAMADKVAARRRRRDGKNHQSVYRCRACGSWHIGTSSNAIKGRRR